LLGFLGLTAFTILVATNNVYAFQFTYVLTLTLAGFFAITQFLQNERDLNRFLSLLVGIHIYLAARVIVNYKGVFGGGGYLYRFSGGSGFLGDENDLALAMILIVPLAVYLFRQARSLQSRLLWGVGGMTILVGIIFTYSRGGFVGLAAMMMYWVATSRRKVKAIGGLVVVAVLLFAVGPSQYWKRIETITETESGTAQVRRNYWAAARRMFYDSPIWGVGGNNFGVLLPDYGIEFDPEKRARHWGRASHSLYFDVLAEFGLIGVMLIGSVILLNFRDLREVIALNRMGRCPPSMGDLARYLQVSWVGFLVSAAFVSVLTYPHLYYLTGLTVVVYRLALAESTEMGIEPIGALQRAG
jgi:O-antigen ligase